MKASYLFIFIICGIFMFLFQFIGEKEWGSRQIKLVTLANPILTEFSFIYSFIFPAISLFLGLILLALFNLSNDQEGFVLVRAVLCSFFALIATFILDKIKSKINNRPLVSLIIYFVISITFNFGLLHR